MPKRCRLALMRWCMPCETLCWRRNGEQRMWAGEQESSWDRWDRCHTWVARTPDFGLLCQDPTLLLRGGLASAMFIASLLRKGGNRMRRPAQRQRESSKRRVPRAAIVGSYADTGREAARHISPRASRRGTLQVGHPGKVSRGVMLGDVLWQGLKIGFFRSECLSVPLPRQEKRAK